MAAKTSARKYLAQKMAQGEGYRVRAKDDSKTCAYCRSMHGKYKNNGGEAPPFHPNCRCTK